MDYYGDNDRSACAWMRELVAGGHLPDGVVVEKDIKQIDAFDLLPHERVHLFAGIGGWAYALELAGFPRGRVVWSGSCPCQPFSAAGKRKGQSDERHLWPVFFRLIRECRPATVFGEQVASDDGYRWLARVRDDLETAGYAVGCADLPACSVGAPHIRQRLFWVAHAGQPASERNAGTFPRTKTRKRGTDGSQHGDRAVGLGDGRPTRRLADAGHGEHRRPSEFGPGSDDTAERRQETIQPERCREAGGLGDANGSGLTNGADAGPDRARRTATTGSPTGCAVETWNTSRPIDCADGKARRIEPAIFPLAHGIPGRVGLLRGAGNAIVPQVAAKFIRAFLEAEHELTKE